MLAVFIPFFLTTNLSVNSDTWKYGPEYHFPVQLSVEKINISEPGFTHGINASTRMVCRPKESEPDNPSDVLSCFISGYETRYYLRESDSYKTKTEGANVCGKMEKQPWEIKFDREGVKSLTVSKDMSGIQFLLVVKFVSNLFNVGVDLEKQSDSKFDKKDNYVLGDCLTHYKIERSPAGHVNHAKSFDLDIMFMNKAVQERVTIEKIRDHEVCNVTNSYEIVLGSVPGIFGEQEVFNTRFSNSSIIVEDNVFESHIRMKSMRFNERGAPELEFTEHAYITLDNITPATDKLQDVQDPEVHSVYLDFEELE